MSEDERQRQMDFILDSLARLSANTDRMAEIQAHDRQRLKRLEESFVLLTEMARSHEERHDRTEARVANMEEAVALLTRIVGKSANGES